MCSVLGEAVVVLMWLFLKELSMVLKLDSRPKKQKHAAESISNVSVNIIYTNCAVHCAKQHIK